MPNNTLPATYHATYEFDKYSYIPTKPKLVRFKYTLALITWSIAVLGFVNFLNLNFWYWILFGPLFAVAVYSNWLTFLILSVFPDFDLKKHHEKTKNYWLKKSRTQCRCILAYLRRRY